MESINETATTEFVTAEELRDLTISVEDRFEREIIRDTRDSART